MIIERKEVVILILLVTVVCMSCNPNRIDSRMNMTDKESYGQSIVISPTKHKIFKEDIDSLNRISISFIICNKSESVKYFKEIATLCDCIQITSAVDSICPMDSIELSGYVNVSKVDGFVNKSIFVSMKSGENFILRVQGEINK